MTIISYLQQLQTAVFDHDLKGSGASIDSIFNELLQRMHRCNDNFASGDLIDDILVKSLEQRSAKAMSEGKAISCLNPLRRLG